MKITKYIIATLYLFLVPYGVKAIVAKPGVINALQPDGTYVKIIQNGDEAHHITYTEDGYLVWPDEDGYYVMGDIDDEGNLISTGLKVVDRENRSKEYNSRLSEIKAKNFTMPEKEIISSQQLRAKRNGPGLMSTQFPALGEQKSVVILVAFNDKDFRIENPQDYFHRLLNEENFNEDNATGSVRDFYIGNSQGRFLPEFDVYGPVKLDKDYSYYGKNKNGGDQRPAEMIIEACKLLDGEVDFSQYDRNGDGLIDNVYVFYAGYGEADGGGADTVWPHSWDILYATDEEIMLDGVRLAHYACSNEIQNYYQIPTGIGTFCHEFSHVLGLPDLYSTVYNGAFTPGEWDLMDAGSYNNYSHTPANMSAYEKYALDWIDPVPLDFGEYEMSSTDETHICYLVPTAQMTEFFLIENRQKRGFDRYIPGHGLLVWHIDFVPEKWYMNEVNNELHHQHVDLVEADNVRSTSTRAADSFPGNRRIDEFSCQTTPAFKSWLGESMPYRLSEIWETYDGVVTFNVSYCDDSGVANISSDLSDLMIEGNQVVNRGDKIVEIYDLSGRKIVAAGKERIELPHGLYIAKSGAAVVKFMIK